MSGLIAEMAGRYEVLGGVGEPHGDTAVKAPAVLGIECASALGDIRLGHTRLLIDSTSREQIRPRA
jgi:hypothetical protein